ncbi:3982_t:CDS:1 [Ambispora gerdemannii]|uniref:3982_t:CDS:1 n=1 Tax=Ambispora gerdemannii TaxID=144530 RepID=A0A9N9BPQ6_9GLOM|nr:3982_t:CDS:1 [Ambispora gerdemannii]
MAKEGSSTLNNRQYEEREEGKFSRGSGRDADKGRREGSFNDRERVRGEGGRGGRRRDRRKDSSGTLTTPTPEILPKSFYQAPVILERKPQSTTPMSTPSTTTAATTANLTPTIATKSNANSISAPTSTPARKQFEEEASSPQTSNFPPSPLEDFVHNLSISSGSRDPETKLGILRPKKPEKPFQKMINEKGTFLFESVAKTLTEHPGHFVVGVCGPQGSGKSTILSALCQDPNNAFPVQSNEALNFASHETIGIDIHVTPERIILLDTQPLFSLSILERAVRNDYIPDHISPELWLEMQSLQFIIFLLSVCNVVIAVTESIDLNTWNFLRKAEMLKYRISEFPTLPSLASADGNYEYYPDIVLVSNKNVPDDFTTKQYDNISDLLRQIFNDSNLKIFNTISLAKILPIYKPRSKSKQQKLPNFYMLPFEPNPYRPKSEGYTLKYLAAPDNFATLAIELRNQVFELPKKSGKKGQVSEREWLRNAVKTWEIVRKSDFIAEYGKLAQKLREM